MDLVAGVPAHTCMAFHSSRRGRCGGSRGIPTVVAAAAATVVVVVWLVGLSAPAPVWAGVPARPQVPAAGSALAAVATGAVVGVVAVGEIQGPAVVQVWCYSGGQRLTRRAYWHCFRVGRS